MVRYPSTRAVLAWVLTFTIVLVWSAIEPKDAMTWWLEVSPALIGLVLLGATLRRFALTSLTYILILLHCVILMVGGHFTYAEVPLFDYLKPVFGFERNNYDKLGHFAQGLVPAIITREIFIRRTPLQKGGWLNLVVISVCLAFSAFYELLEWWVALLSDEAAEAFLGTQGYAWDTQSDMGWALLGAITALLALSRYHDRQLARSGFFPHFPQAGNPRYCTRP
jgi:putative membrane protein